MNKLVLIVLFALFASACQRPFARQASVEPPVTQAPLPAMSIADRSEVPRITLTEAKQHFDQETAYFVDTRPASAYEAQHIAGAFHLTPADLQAHLHELPKDKLVITYCT